MVLSDGRVRRDGAKNDGSDLGFLAMRDPDGRYTLSQKLVSGLIGLAMTACLVTAAISLLILLFGPSRDPKLFLFFVFMTAAMGFVFFTSLFARYGIED